MSGRRAIGGAIPLLVTAVMLLSCAGTSHSGRVTVVNGASEAIARAEVVVCNQPIVFEAIPPNGERVDEFEVRGDSSYRVRVVYASGRKVVGEIGYVTPGFDTSVTIVAEETTVVVGAVDFK